MINIYTDGSHKPKENFLGIGCYCSYKGIDYGISDVCDDVMYARYDIKEKKLSNPTAEFLAFAETLRVFVENEHVDHIHTLRFHIDYEGVRKWMSCEWQAKKPYIKKIRDKCLEMINEIPYTVEYRHVKGHSGVYGNDCADILAKSKIRICNIDDMIKLIGGSYQEIL